MHICVSNLIIGSDNGLSPGRRQDIILTNAGILLIGPLGTNFTEILIEIDTFSFKKMHLKMSSGKIAAILSRPQCVKMTRHCSIQLRNMLAITAVNQANVMYLGQSLPIFMICFPAWLEPFDQEVPMFMGSWVTLCSERQFSVLLSNLFFVVFVCFEVQKKYNRFFTRFMPTPWIFTMGHYSYCGTWIIQGRLGQYHGWWCAASCIARASAAIILSM